MQVFQRLTNVLLRDTEQPTQRAERQRREDDDDTSEDLSQHMICLFFLLICVFGGNGMLEDSRVDLVKVLRRCYGSAAIVLEDRIESFGCKSFPFTDKSTGSCGPNEQSTCGLDQASDGLVARPAGIQRAFLSDKSEVGFQENVDVAIDNRRRYVVEHEV